MNIEWFVANLTAVGSPDRAERAILGVILAGCATLRCRKPLLNSDNFTWGRLLDIEWLVTNVAAVCPAEGAEGALLGMSLARQVFGQFRRYYCSRGANLRCRGPLLSPNNFT